MEIGLRQQHKIHKLHKIKIAATALFTEKGFDAATTREIAQRAHVAQATIFLYARDKRDLVFLILNDELDQLTQEFVKAAKPDIPLFDQLVSSFSVFYTYYAKNSNLARILLKELTFYYEGEQARRFGVLRDKVVSQLEHLLVVAQNSRSIRSEEKLDLVARDLFFSYQGALRWWIAGPEPKAAKGIAEFRRIIRLHLKALNPSPKAF